MPVATAAPVLSLLIPCAVWRYRAKVRVKGRGRQWVTFEKIGPGHWMRANPGANGGMFNHDEHDAWMRICARHMRAAVERAGMDTPVLTGPVQLSIEFAMPRRSRAAKRSTTREWHIDTPDASNLLKAIEDAGNRILWTDDRRVVELRVRKFECAPGEQSHVRLSIADLTFTPVPRPRKEVESCKRKPQIE